MAHPKEIEVIKHYIKEGKDKIMKIVRTNETTGGLSGEVSRLESGTLEDFENYNKRIGNDWVTDARQYNLDVIKQWIKIRDNYTYVPKYVGGKWESIDIRKDHTRMGTNYIFIEDRKKLWRIHTTFDEFYGEIPKPFKFENNNN